MNRDEVWARLNAMSEALVAQRAKATDPAVKKELLDRIKEIEALLNRLTLMNDAEVAREIDAASSCLKDLMTRAIINPFDSLIRKSFKEVADQVVQEADAASKEFVCQEFHAWNRGQPAIVPDFTPPVPNAPPPVPPLAVGELPPIVVGTKLAELAQDYALCWAACSINAGALPQVNAVTDRMLKGRPRYEAVSARTNGVPWQLIGIMHGMECGYDFFKHLHNGDSLAAPTHNVPAGRPPGWDGTGSWEDSAVDAVEYKFKGVTTWSLPQTLYALECFNGFGYRQFGIRSPYLWSFSNLYAKGRYVCDHDFDPASVSQQVGAALILKALEQRGLWP